MLKMDTDCMSRYWERGAFTNMEKEWARLLGMCLIEEGKV